MRRDAVVHTPMTDDDFDKPQVGVASSWNEVTPCNYHLDKLAALLDEGHSDQLTALLKTMAQMNYLSFESTSRAIRSACAVSISCAGSSITGPREVFTMIADDFIMASSWAPSSRSWAAP